MRFHNLRDVSFPIFKSENAFFNRSSGHHGLTWYSPPPPICRWSVSRRPMGPPRVQPLVEDGHLGAQPELVCHPWSVCWRSRRPPPSRLRSPSGGPLPASAVRIESEWPRLWGIGVVDGFIEALHHFQPQHQGSSTRCRNPPAGGGDQGGSGSDRALETGGGGRVPPGVTPSLPGIPPGAAGNPPRPPGEPAPVERVADRGDAGSWHCE